MFTDHHILSRSIMGSCHKAKLSLLQAIALSLSLFLTLSAHSAEPTDVAILEPLKYTDLDSLRRIQEAVMPAAEAGNIIAVNIARQTMYALGQDMLLEKTKHLCDVKYDPKNENIQAWLAQVTNKADRGDPFFQVVLGILYCVGDCVEKNGKKAFEWWQKAAEAGYPDGVNKLSNAYWNGIGVPVDKRIAVQYAKKAADLDHPMALYNMGCYHDKGKYMPRDLVKAKFYWLRSAKMGHAWSQYNLGWVYMYKYGGDRLFNLTLTKKIARDWYAKAAAQGHATAQQELSSQASYIPDYSRPSIPLPRDIESNPLVDSLLNEYKKPSTRKSIPATKRSTSRNSSAKEPTLNIPSEVNSKFSKEQTACLGKAEAEGQIVVAIIPARGKHAPPPESVAEMEVAFSKNDNVTLVERQEIEKILSELDYSAAGHVSLETRLALSRIIPAHTMLFVEKLGSAKNSSLAIQAVDTRTGVKSGIWLLDSSETDNSTAILPEIASRILESSRVPYEQKHCISLIGIRNEHQRPELEQFASALHTLCCRQLANAADIVLLDRHHLEHLRKEKQLTAIEQQLLGSTVIVEGGIRPSAQPEELDVSIIFQRPENQQDQALSMTTPANDVANAAMMVSKAIAAHFHADSSQIIPFSKDEESHFFLRQAILSAHWRQFSRAVKMSEAAYALNPKNSNALELADHLKALGLNLDIESSDALSCFLRADRIVLDVLQNEYAEYVNNGSTNFPILDGTYNFRTEHGRIARNYSGLYLPRIEHLRDPEKEQMRLQILDIEEKVFRLQLKYCTDDYTARWPDFWHLWSRRMAISDPNEGILDYYPGDTRRQLQLLGNLVDDFVQYKIPEATSLPQLQMTSATGSRYTALKYISQYMWDGCKRMYSSPAEKQMCYDFCLGMTKHTNSYVRFTGCLSLMRMKEDVPQFTELAYNILTCDFLPEMTSCPPSEIQSGIDSWYNLLHSLNKEAAVQPIEYTRRFINHMVETQQAHLIPEGTLANALDNMTAATDAENTIEFITEMREKLNILNNTSSCSQIDTLFAQKAASYQAELVEGVPVNEASHHSSPTEHRFATYCQISQLPLYLDVRAVPFLVARGNNLFCIRSVLGPITVEKHGIRSFSSSHPQKLSIDIYQLPSMNMIKAIALPLPFRFSKRALDQFDVYSTTISNDGNELFVGTRVGLGHVHLDSKTVDWLGPKDGLPSGVIRAMGFLDKKLYLSMGNERYNAISYTNTAAFAVYDTVDKSLTTLDSETSIQNTSTPLAENQVQVGTILADEMRKCLWLLLSPPRHLGPKNRSMLFQLWKYSPKNNTFQRLRDYADGYVVAPNTRMLGSTMASGKVFLFSTDTCGYTRIPTHISKKHYSCEAATWLGNDILYTGSYRGGTANLYLYTPGEKEPKLIDRLPDGSPMPEIVLLTSTDYGVLAVSSKGETFLINPLDEKEAADNKSDKGT